SVFSECVQQLPKPGILLIGNGLDAGRAVHMSGGGQSVAEFVSDMRHIKHVRVSVLLAGIDFENFRGGFGGDDWSEWTECFALFDERVDAVAHGRIARVGENTAAAEGAWAKFHSPLKPGYDLAFGETFSD